MRTPATRRPISAGQCDRFWRHDQDSRPGPGHRGDLAGTVPPATDAVKSGQIEEHSGRVVDLVHYLTHISTMKRINIHDAKTHLSRYLEHVERGESFLVCRRNAPVAELRPVRRERTKARPVGLAKGTFRVPATFFKPLPRELLEAFDGKGR